jgi:hypothetical protein
MSEEELKREVRQLKKAVFGDMENPKENPGVIAELAQMNATLLELRDSMRKVNNTVIFGFLTALIAMVFKGFS